MFASKICRSIVFFNFVTTCLNRAINGGLEYNFGFLYNRRDGNSEYPNLKFSLSGQ